MSGEQTFPILFENDDFVAINKPSGVMTHPDGRNEGETVSDWFARTYPKSAGVGETQRLQDGTEILRSGIVHRLDRETSGVLVLAKTPEAHAFLKELFQSHEVQKTYLALVYGTIKESKGAIDFPIGRSNKDFRLRSAQPKAKGSLREAVTTWVKVGETPTHTLLKVMPKTGRTHQIRVHLKAIHHPVVCDPLYAPNQKCDLGFNRLGLHAYQIAFKTLAGEEISIEAPVPPELAEAVKKMGGGEEFLAAQ